MAKKNIYVSEKYLQNILNEMKDIVEQDLIFMNTEGVIIVSTVESRIGTIHYGGKKVARTDQDLIIYSDDEYKGAKPGISMPVKLDDTIIGVIGITGNSDEVIRYVKIIKRLTEIFVKEGYNKDIENNEIEKDRLIMESFIFSDVIMEKNHIIRYENLFGIKNNIPRIVMIATIVGHENKKFLNKENVYRIIRGILKNDKTIISLSGSNIVIISENTKREYLDTIIDKIKTIVKHKTHLNLKFGIGDIQTELANIKNSYMNANDALKWSLLVSKKEITYYDEMDIEILLNNIPSTYAQKYIDKILKEIDSAEYGEYLKIIELYEKHNGSIKRISEELFIHKNTLQYKINKLHIITGYDMRNLRDYQVLRIAFILKKFYQFK